MNDKLFCFNVLCFLKLRPAHPIHGHLSDIRWESLHAFNLQRLQTFEPFQTSDCHWQIKNWKDYSRHCHSSGKVPTRKRDWTSPFCRVVNVQDMHVEISPCPSFASITRQRSKSEEPRAQTAVWADARRLCLCYKAMTFSPWTSSNITALAKPPSEVTLFDPRCQTSNTKDQTLLVFVLLLSTWGIVPHRYLVTAKLWSKTSDQSLVNRNPQNMELSWKSKGRKRSEEKQVASSVHPNPQTHGCVIGGMCGNCKLPFRSMSGYD